MIVSTSEHAALGAAVLRERQYAQMQERRIKQLSLALEKAEKARQESSRQNVALLARIKDTESLAQYFYEEWVRMCQWWAQVLEHLRAYKDREKWAMALDANQELTPEIKTYERGLAYLLRVKQPDGAGMVRVDAAEMQRLTGIPERTQRRIRERLGQAGAIQEKTVFNPRTVRSATYIGFAPDGAAPAEQRRAADAPQRGGQRISCPACSSDDVLVEQKLLKRVRCRDCGTVTELDMPWQLISAASASASEQLAELLAEPSYDAYSEQLPPPAAPPTQLFPTPAPSPIVAIGRPSLVAESPCPVCGSLELRERLGLLVCAGCYPNPFAKGVQRG